MQPEPEKIEQNINNIWLPTTDGKFLNFRTAEIGVLEFYETKINNMADEA